MRARILSVGRKCGHSWCDLGFYQAGMGHHIDTGTSFYRLAPSASLEWFSVQLATWGPGSGKLATSTTTQLSGSALLANGSC